MKSITALLSMTIIGTIASSCTIKLEGLLPETEDLVKYELFLDVDDTVLSSERKDILNKINSNNKVSFKAVTNELITEQAQAFEKNESARNANYVSVDIIMRGRELGSRLEDLSNKTRGQNYFQTKAIYEAAIEKELAAKLVFNQDYTAVSDITNKGKKQCVSGTHLNLLLQRKSLSGEKFREANYVVIMTAGHILPGQMIKKGDQWQLFGVETTAKGDAIIDYGRTSYLRQAMRIVDADYYNIISLYNSAFKDSASARTAMSKALDYTAQKYGIPLDQLEKLVLDEQLKGTKYSTKARNEENFNSSIFSFGVSKVASGDLDPSIFNSPDTQTFESLRSELVPTDKTTELPVSENEYNRTEPVINTGMIIQGCFRVQPTNQGSFQLLEYSCHELFSDISIPGPITDIADGVFEGKGLRKVQIPDGVKTIGNLAFKDNKLTSIRIPDGVEFIGSEAFAGNSISCVYLPASVSFSGHKAFDEGVHVTRNQMECPTFDRSSW